MARLVVMPSFKSSDEFEFNDTQGCVNSENTNQEVDDLMESILENINTTPIGRVLKRIAYLPEISRGKVLSVRRQITEGTYDVADRLDDALDRVIEDLTV